MPSAPSFTIIEAQLLLDAQADLGEGSIWHPAEQKLYWINITGCLLNIYDPATGVNRSLPTGSRIGTVVPVEGGDVLVALQNGIHRMNTTTGELTLIVNPITGLAIRFNDGKCDPSGRFWVGTMAMDGTRGAASLYRLDRDGTLHEMLHGVSISNGIVWTADRRTMYYNDTPTATVQAFDYDDASGSISNRRVAFEIGAGGGFPDGMTIDAEDKLWIAMWGAGCVNRYDPLTGRLMQQVTVPALHASSCAFGGPDLSTLFITTARSEMAANALAASPLAGALFTAVPGVRGVPAGFYRPL